MTNTEAVLLTNKEARTAWIAGLIRAAHAIPEGAPSQLWDGLALLMLQDGPILASETNRWWPRRFVWIRQQLEAGADPRDVVITALRDMKIANDYDGR